MVAVFAKFAFALFLVGMALFFASSGLALKVRAQQDGPDCMEVVRYGPVSQTILVSPGEIFESVWRVENCGESPWIRYRAVKVFGEFGQNSFAVPDTAAGTENELSLVIQVPTTPGTYTAIFELTRPFGDMRRMTRFGEPLVIEFRVAQSIKVYLGDETEVEIKIEVEE